MRTVIDDSLLSRRRTIETAALVARTVGLIYTLAYTLGSGGWAGPPLSAGMLAACWLGIGAMSAADVFAWAARRRPRSHRYPMFSALQVALDTLTIVMFVVLTTRESPQTTWPLLSLAICVAAVRHRLAGALTVFALSSAAFLLLVPESPDHAFVIGVNLMIAVITGTQSSAFARQLTTLQRIRAALHHQANHDPLTGLPNRGRLADHADRHTGQPFAVLLLDLNGFKQVNDTHGHAAGDLLLREIGGRLSGVLRDGDLAGRLGGDEFLVLLPDAGDAEAAGVADRIRQVVRRPVRLGDGREVTVGVSVGQALRAAGSDVSLEALTAEADAAMYRDKRKLAA
ncbi:GGDEF domain-containing protein [Actinoplanes sp. DH11]|uniref:GGDEF domain-containing protein n=1 Tax=Actinoplanes sp. DH11 TaxID=2857011 RepID=UPI001E5EFB4C|nr:GGDEF domain-containing protein [Actinoplanes sp. DH11]